MAYDQILLKGTTGYMVEVALRSSTDGQALGGLAAGSVACTYWREGAAAGTVVTLNGGAALGTWTTGGWKETSVGGLYQFGIPNAALATGANAVTLVFQASGAIDKFVRIVLEGVDRRDATNFGVTTLTHLATALELNAGNYRFTVAALANAPGGGGGGGGSWDDESENGESYGQTIRLMRAAILGESPGVSGGVQQFLGADGVTVRIIGTVGAFGARSSLTLDPD